MKIMKNKIVIFSVLFVLFAPAVSYGMIVPTANLIVVVDSQSDASFHFHLTGSPDFDLQTSNLTASKNLNIMAFTGAIF